MSIVEICPIPGLATWGTDTLAGGVTITQQDVWQQTMPTTELLGASNAWTIACAASCHCHVSSCLAGNGGGWWWQVKALPCSILCFQHFRTFELFLVQISVIFLPLVFRRHTTKFSFLKKLDIDQGAFAACFSMVVSLLCCGCHWQCCADWTWDRRMGVVQVRVFYNQNVDFYGIF